MDKQYLLSEINNNGIATVTLNRPTEHNTIDDVMVQQLTQVFNLLNNDANVSCIILRANGDHFCSGADLSWMKAMINYTQEENIYDALNFAKLLNTLYQLDKPVIAIAQGEIFGGGIGILACCDAVVVSDEARFCFSEVKYGLMPATLAPFIINAIGPRHTKYYFLTAEPFNTQTALIIGLAHRIVQRQQLEQAGKRLAEQIIPHSQPAISAAKQLLRKLVPINYATHKETARIMAELRVSAEAQKRLKAFLKNNRS